MKKYLMKTAGSVLMLICVMMVSLSLFTAADAEDEQVKPDNGIPVVYLNIDESQGTV